MTTRATESNHDYPSHLDAEKKSLHAVFSLLRRSNSVVTVYIQASLLVIQTYPTAQQLAIVAWR
jgi:hypothetical protein